MTRKGRSVYQFEGSIVGAANVLSSISSPKSCSNLVQTNITYLAIQTKFDLIELTMKLCYPWTRKNAFFLFTALFSEKD